MPIAPSHPRRPIWSWLAIGVSLPYAAGVLAFFALRAFASTWPPFCALLAHFGPFLFAPLILLLPLALLARSRVALAAVLVVLALFLALYGPFLLPRLGAAPPLAGRPLVVMTLNLGPARAAPAQVVAAIAQEGADIAAVQELTPAAAQALREGLGERYPHLILEPTVADTGLLSRFPILANQRFVPAGFGRRALQATVEVDGLPIQILVVHPRPPEFCWNPGWPVPTGIRYRPLEEQIADIAARAAALPAPVLVLGDFNMSDLSRAYGSIAAVLGDGFQEAGWGFGFTFPVGFRLRGAAVPDPLLRIDYIFHSSDLYPMQAQVRCRSGSDHCYVVVRLRRIAGGGP